MLGATCERRQYDANFERRRPCKPEFHQHLSVMGGNVVWIAPPACDTRWTPAFSHYCSLPGINLASMMCRQMQGAMSHEIASI